MANKQNAMSPLQVLRKAGDPCLHPSHCGCNTPAVGHVLRNTLMKMCLKNVFKHSFTQTASPSLPIKKDTGWEVPCALLVHGGAYDLLSSLEKGSNSAFLLTIEIHCVTLNALSGSFWMAPLVPAAFFSQRWAPLLWLGEGTLPVCMFVVLLVQEKLWQIELFRGGKQTVMPWFTRKRFAGCEMRCVFFLRFGGHKKEQCHVFF